MVTYDRQVFPRMENCTAHLKKAVKCEIKYLISHFTKIQKGFSYWIHYLFFFNWSMSL